MDDTDKMGSLGEIRWVIRNCAKIEAENKFKYRQKTSKYVIVKKKKVITEKVKGGVILKMEDSRYIGKTMEWAK